MTVYRFSTLRPIIRRVLFRRYNQSHKLEMITILTSFRCDNERENADDSTYSVSVINRDQIIFTIGITENIFELIKLVKIRK